jgi:CO/xanthine dehydrogenase FAD-binding subunit
MKNFAHVKARSLDEAVAVLRRYGKKAVVMAGV